MCRDQNLYKKYHVQYFDKLRHSVISSLFEFFAARLKNFSPATLIFEIALQESKNDAERLHECSLR